jgi:hypothetical protein
MGLDFRTAGIPYDEDLDFTERAHWSYSGFHRFRERLAGAIGLKLDEMEGFGGHKAWDEAHPLTALLNHSDCEGELSGAQCGLVAFGLNEIIYKWPEDDYDRQNAQKLFNHMVKCLETRRALQFS